MKQIGILGSGGQADEAESFLDDVYVVFRAVDADFLNNSKDTYMIDVSLPKPEQKSVPVVGAVGSPLVRKKLVKSWPGKKFYTILSRLAFIDNTSTIAQGSIVAPGVIITTGVNIGEHVIINVSATIAHNCVLGDYSTIGPGAHIAGNVNIGSGVFIGIGASIKNNVRIADGVVIGAGAVVLSDIIEENSVYAGVPAKKIGQNTQWLSEVK